MANVTEVTMDAGRAEMRWTSTQAGCAAAALLVVVGCLLPGDTAAAAAGRHPQWASARSATIHPGVSVSMGGVTCRAGFIFTDGTHAFVSVPASCSGSGPVDNSKCDAGQDPLGLPVTIAGAKHKGRLVYSSITMMQLRSQRSVNRCTYNDLSLVRLDNRDIKRAKPSVPALGGPTGISTAQPAAPDQLSVYTITASPAEALQTSGGGWSHSMMVDGLVTGTDIGAPVLTGNGQALGMVSGVPTANGQTLDSDLGREVHYLQTVRQFADVHLAKGTVKFSPALSLRSA
jgi:hypothetical protein